MNIRRRTALAFMLAACGQPRLTFGQPVGKVARIGWLTSGAIVNTPVWEAFIAGMRERGWIEGQNFTIDHLLSEGHNERFPALAAELVRRKVDVIITAGTPPTTAARNATSTIPIVFYFTGDPVGSGFVASLARPGGNVTGLGGLGRGIYAKMLELLREVVPKASRIAILLNSDIGLHATALSEAEHAARRVGVSLKPVELRAPEELDGAFAAIARERPDGLLVLGQPFMFGHRARLAALALEQRLPAIVPFKEVVDAGLLMSYGSQLMDDVRRLPYYIDRILKGTPPGELPVEQPTRFYLTLNLNTARAIGVAISPTVLRLADEVIQ